METVRKQTPPPPLPQEATLRLHMWFESEGTVVFGLGRMLLLKQLDQLGSLKGAAQSMGMSYRAAWGKLKATEEALGSSVVEKDVGHHSRYRLTPFGKKILKQYQHLLDEVEEFALKLAKKDLPFTTREFQNDDRKT